MNSPDHSKLVTRSFGSPTHPDHPITHPIDQVIGAIKWVIARPITLITPIIAKAKK